MAANTTIPGSYKVAEPQSLSHRTNRIASIDLLRGIVMVIMALDHVRDYFHFGSQYTDPTDLEFTTPGLFFTRWITHFCAPTFMFLTGTSAYLVGLRKTKRELAWFLFTRGLWIMLLEETLMNFGWSFNPGFSQFPLITLWALGTTMIALSALIFLPYPAILGIGLAIVFGHNLLDSIHVPGQDLKAFLWAELHDPNFFMVGGKGVFVGYPVLPWIGVGALGYCFGRLYRPEMGPAHRQRILLRIGGAAIALFILIRYLNVYGDPQPWSEQKNGLYTLLSFLNVTKYPPSLLYDLVTLGPAILFLGLAEHPLRAFEKPIVTIGRVPFFYYILHVYLIHALALVAAHLTGFDWHRLVIEKGWISAQDYGFPMWVVYLVWIGVVVSLYPLCRWYDRYKTTHKEQWWLSYL